MTKINWAPLYTYALCDLHLRPKDFWALTPYEFSLMSGLTLQGTPMTRQKIHDLEAQFDHKEKQ
jgi:uncharacterized phage protein (TIGR02216 family)